MYGNPNFDSRLEEPQAKFFVGTGIVFKYPWQGRRPSLYLKYLPFANTIVEPRLKKTNEPYLDSERKTEGLDDDDHQMNQPLKCLPHRSPEASTTAAAEEAKEDEIGAASIKEHDTLGKIPSLKEPLSR